MFPSFDSLTELENYQNTLGKIQFWGPVVVGAIGLFVATGWGIYSKKIETRVNELRDAEAKRIEADKTADRCIKPEQRTAIVSALQRMGHRRLVDISASTQGDALLFAKEIAELFKAAGWAVRGPATSDAISFFGMRCDLPLSDGNLKFDTYALMGIFLDAGIPLDYIENTSASSTGRLAITVGRKPVGDQKPSLADARDFLRQRFEDRTIPQFVSAEIAPILNSLARDTELRILFTQRGEPERYAIELKDLFSKANFKLQEPEFDTTHPNVRGILLVDKHGPPEKRYRNNIIQALIGTSFSIPFEFDDNAEMITLVVGPKG